MNKKVNHASSNVYTLFPPRSSVQIYLSSDNCYLTLDMVRVACMYIVCGTIFPVPASTHGCDLYSLVSNTRNNSISCNCCCLCSYSVLPTAQILSHKWDILDFCRRSGRKAAVVYSGLLPRLASPQCCLVILISKPFSDCIVRVHSLCSWCPLDSDKSSLLRIFISGSTSYRATYLIVSEWDQDEPLRIYSTRNSN